MIQTQITVFHFQIFESGLETPFVSIKHKNNIWMHEFLLVFISKAQHCTIQVLLQTDLGYQIKATLKGKYCLLIVGNMIYDI